MGNEDGGDAERELPFLRFVPKKVHPQKCADATTGYGQTNESRFRYAPLPFTGLPFVDPEDKESQNIDADEIYNDCSQNRFLFFRQLCRWFVSY